jgi:glycosyltransferase involved in cell wall biosynthesis
LSKPEVSVIVGVFNSVNTLPATLDSILSQEGIDLEVVVVDDGSFDGSGDILRDYAARDRRLDVLKQKNMGLTRALIRGCEVARGEFIAHQIAFLRSQAETVMTACGTQFIGPEGELLYAVCHSGRELHDQLRATSFGRLRGPSHHGAVMFRKDAYRRVGGYRDAFRVAQDLDLWSRMAEAGLCLATPNIFYQARLTKESISSLNQTEQRRAARAILLCAEARREGHEESFILERLRGVKVKKRSALTGRMQEARFYYFVGSMLREREGHHAAAYFLRALFCWPLYPRAWFRFLRSFLRTNAERPKRGCVA